MVPSPQQRSYHLLGLDVTPVPRPHACTLEERGFVYQPNLVRGNKPINIGHAYSILAELPEKVSPYQAPWSIPLSGQRVGIDQSDKSVGIEQIQQLLSNPELPWAKKLSVLAVDSAYGVCPFLFKQAQHENLVTLARVRSNRVFYQSPPLCEEPAGRGHPLWYGERFDLKDESTWHQPDETIEFDTTTARGRLIHVSISAWRQMLMRGSKDCPMHQHPFTLHRILLRDAETGKAIFKRPMWLIAIGKRRHELSPRESYQDYCQRFDLEHLFRFSKQKLLMGAYQTPEGDYEENWIQLSLLAYVQLWAARELTVHLPRPWERYLPQPPQGRITPSNVQRDWNRITAQMGTPAAAPKPRGKSPGRLKGQSQPPRERQPVIKKGKKAEKKQPVTT